MPSKINQLSLLHLSDLHIRDDAEQKTDRGMVLDPLLERLKTDYDLGLRPELVLVTGDIAFQGIKAEYDLALPFLKDLLAVLNLEDQCLYMVPGNHDVYRRAYRPSEIPVYGSQREINQELADDDYRADLLKGMKAYFEFIRKLFPHMTSKHGDLVPFVDRIRTQGGVSLGLVGLNSAWMCRAAKPGEDDSGRIAIGEHQIKSAFQELRGKGHVQATVALFHHPLSWLAPMDRSVCETYLNRTIALAGHLHEPGGGYLRGLASQMARIQGGGAYLGSDSGWPCRYHYLSLDLEGKSLRLDFRAFSSSKRHWYVDAETGDDAGKAQIPADFLGTLATDPTPAAPGPKPPKFPGQYARWLTENLGYLDADRLQPRGKALPLSLPELFVPLLGSKPVLDELGDEEVARLYAHIPDAVIYSRNRNSYWIAAIEELAAESAVLLIEGQAGCGKSTLLKHLAYTISPDSDKAPASPTLAEYLPVLVPLKQIQDYCRDDITKLEREASPGEELLEWYLTNRVNGTLSLDTLHEFMQRGRLLLLVDGLDEIERPLRDHALNALADLLLNHPENKLVMAGRPHGLEGLPTDRFGRYRTTVRDLSPKHIETFIRQWFDYFYPGTEGVGRKTADELLGDIAGHTVMGKLTVNPLMLTAICLLYHDGKELPDQRAELFKKFIDNLIWRRFADPERVLDHLKRLAHGMHKSRARMTDRLNAIQIMAGSFAPAPGAERNAFDRSAEEQFNDIEPRCGLLINEGGQTGFWHLAFQEFLTAQHLMDSYEDKREAIENLWDDEWYWEVIELYVSYLSIDNRKTANNLVLAAVERQDESPFQRWRLAGRAFMDFHESRRDPGVSQRVRERLKLIIRKPLEAATLVDVGETLGWLGDDRDLESFATVAGGEYNLEDIGKRSIEPFGLGRYPVTIQFFSRFVADGGYTNQDWWTEQAKQWLGTMKPDQPAWWKDRALRCPNQPVTGVSFFEAEAFCRWLTENDTQYLYFLPTEAQWQAAAAGKEQREYPWGAGDPTGRGNFSETRIGRPSPVGIFPDGCTLGGGAAIHDLAGNVWEWTSSFYDDDKDRYVLKGRSWFTPAVSVRCAYRNHFLPAYRNVDVGFRCARTKK